MTFQIGEGLENTLLSVRKLTECGCCVVLGSDDGDFIHFKASDKYIPVCKEDGLYKVNLWINTSSHKTDMTVGTGNLFYYNANSVTHTACETVEQDGSGECLECLRDEPDSVFVRRR